MPSSNFAGLQVGFRLTRFNPRMAKFPFFGQVKAEPVGASPSTPWRWTASVDTLLLLSSLFWAVAGNTLFFSAALQGRSWNQPAAWAWALALGVMVVGLHVLVLAPLANRWTVKPLLTLLIVTSALATYYMQRYGVYFDPSMVRNVLATDLSESRELLTPSLLPHLLGYAVLPLVLLWRVDIRPVPLPRAVFRRLAVMAVAAAATVVAVVTVYQPLASLMRNHKEVRYLITPANYLWSAAAVGLAQAKGAAAPRQALGLDAQPGPSWTAKAKPRLLVLVVGETARAANWGLNGYARQTTPELAQLPVINFSQVGSCGTNTEVSVPCMFAPVGRRDYDEARIQGSESLLHVLARAGVDVHWRDNQSGCKGVCDGLSMDYVEKIPAAATLCSQGRCLDEGLLIDLDQRLAQVQGTQILVLHQLGNHGPSYFRRYPDAFRKFLPDCRNDDLQRCSAEEIVNAYDNALLYTDQRRAIGHAELSTHDVGVPGRQAGEGGNVLAQLFTRLLFGSVADLAAEEGLRVEVARHQLQVQFQKHHHLTHLGGRIGVGRQQGGVGVDGLDVLHDHGRFTQGPLGCFQVRHLAQRRAAQVRLPHPSQFFLKGHALFKQRQLHFVVVVAGCKATQGQHRRSPLGKKPQSRRAQTQCQANQRHQTERSPREGSPEFTPVGLQARTT